MDEWRAILAPVLYDEHTWPQPLVNIVIDYLYDVRRLVLISHEFSSHDIHIWSLSCNSIHNIMATSTSSANTASTNMVSSNEQNDVCGEWYHHEPLPSKAFSTWCILDHYHDCIIFGNTYAHIYGTPLPPPSFPS
jgi:hypothetical protein